MPRKRNLRMETYNKLISIGKSTENGVKIDFGHESVEML